MRRYFAVMAVGALLLAACSKSTNSSTGSTPSAGASSPAAAASPTGSPNPQPPITATLQHMPAGNAVLTWDPKTKDISATLNMYGFTPGSAHAMHLHMGSCQAQVNPPIIPFPDVTATAAGVISETVTTTSPVPAGIPTGADYLNIHLAPGAQLGTPTSTTFTPIACADIPRAATSGGPDPVTMTALPQVGQHPAATATVVYDSGLKQLTVEVKATGLPPGTAHATHIHSGSCNNQGAVLYGLNDTVADASGNADITTVVKGVTSPPPASGWYVNMHFGPMSGIVDSSGNPTLLFQPILCADVM